MKVRVNYYVVQEEILEVDDRFNKLESSNWVDGMNWQEADKLAEDLSFIVCEKIPYDAELINIYTLDNMTCLYEE